MQTDNRSTEPSPQDVRDELREVHDPMDDDDDDGGQSGQLARV